MLHRGGSVTIISYIKKEPNQSQNKQTNKKTGWKPKHGNPLNLQSTTNQKIHQQTNKQTNIMCKCDFNATTGIWTFPSSTLKISVCWLRGVFCLILESCHASDNKLPSVCLFMSTKSQIFCHMDWHMSHDWSHMLSKPVQVIPKCLSRNKLLQRHHCSLSKVQNTNLAIKNVVFRVISLGFCG